MVETGLGEESVATAASSDEEQGNQLPSYNNYQSPQWSDLMIGGCILIHNWLRSLMWAFDWHDLGRNLIVKRSSAHNTIPPEVMVPHGDGN